MPKIGKTKKNVKRYTEEDIKNAIQAINNGLSQRNAAVKFGVPRATLQFRLSNRFSEKTTPGPDPVLTKNEEHLIEDWINDLHRKGFPLRLEDVQVCVKKFLDDNPRKNPFKENKPGVGWLKAFLKRHPAISLRTAEGVTSASSVVSESDIKKWFSDIQVYLENKGHMDILDDPTRVFNGDETCFYLCPQNKKVLAPKGTKNVYEVQYHPKLNLTVMFTFCAVGESTPPMIIYPYQRIPLAITQSVPDSWGISNSDNGWMTNKIFYEYVGNIFYRHLKKIGTKFPIIYFVDGHKTHMTYELSQLCSELDIILVALYPNATRILQPADVGVFKPLKDGWKAELLKFRRENPLDVVTKEKFAPILAEVLKNHLKSSSIRNGFKACGIYPWNANAVDFTKCLGAGKQALKKVSEIADDTTLKFQDFRKIVSDEKIEQLRLMSFSAADQNEIILKLILQQFELAKVDMEKNNETIESTVSVHDGVPEDPFCPTKNNISFDPKSVSNKVETKNRVIVEAEIHSDPQKNATHFDSISKSVSPVQENIQTFNIEDIPIVFENDYSETRTLAPVDIEVLDKSLNDSFGENHCSSLKLNASIDQYFIHPKTPERKGKRQSQKISFVLTSSARKRDHLKKIEHKKEEERLKEERKTKRLKIQKDKENRNIKINKKRLSMKKPSSFSSPKAYKEPELKEINEKLEDQMEKTQLENRTKEIDKAKKQLFSPIEKGVSSKINIISNVVVNSVANPTYSFENRFSNPTIFEGICYSCTMNITHSLFGVKCAFCLRTYHIKCINKYFREKTDQMLFVCSVCSNQKCS